MITMCNFYLTLFLIAYPCVSSSDNDIMSAKDLKAVQEHYMKYPYPPRSLKESNPHIPPILIHPHMDELNHFFFGGKGDLGRKKVFRILIAGGGTGAGLLHYAYIFQGYKVSIVFLDFSAQSLEISRKRAEAYNFGNVTTYVHSSIYNIPKLNLGLFDFIDCTGVLHHLLDPDEGLQILKDSLAPTGGMVIMLYAYYGRQGVYSLQESLRILNKNMKLSPEEEVQRGRILFNNHNLQSRVLLGGILSDAKVDGGFYDLYLHKQDRAFTISEVYEYIEEKGGLKIVRFLESGYQQLLRESRPEILNHLESKKEHALNEMLHGGEIKQLIFVSKKKCEASVDVMDNVPYPFINNFRVLVEATQEKASKNQVIQVYFTQFRKQEKVLIPLSKYSNVFFKLIANNEYTIGEIVNFCIKKFRSKSKDIGNLRNRILKELKKTLKPLILNEILLLRHKSLEPFKRTKFMNKIDSVYIVNI